MPNPWHAVSFSELLPRLSAIRLSDKSEQCALDTYTELVRLLLEVASAFDPEQESDGRVFLPEVKLGRASALIQKLRMHRCAGWIQHRLTLNAPSVVPGFTRGQGLMEAFVRSEGGIEYGWQLQNRQFRLAIRTIANQRKQPDEFREHAKALADFKRLPRHDYVEFGTTGDALFEPESAQRSNWNKFGDDFIYKHRKLRSDIHWCDLVDLCVRQTENALLFVSERNAG